MDIDADKLLKEQFERMRKLKARIVNILLGLKNHISNVWSFLDVAMIIFLALAGNTWRMFVFENSFNLI
jgi:hypothetical protein